jgi:predicted secreted protein
MATPLSGTAVLVLAQTAATVVGGESFGTGNGTLTSFSHTMANKPVQPATVTLSVGSVTATDDGNGNLIGAGVAGGSTIDYLTGAATLNLITAPANLAAITASYTWIAYSAVASQTQARFDEKTKAIDITNKSSRNKLFIPGEYDATVTLDHLYIPTDAAYAQLKSAMRNGATVMVQRQESGAALEQASAIVTQMSGDFKDKAPATIAVTMQITGPWTT